MKSIARLQGNLATLESRLLDNLRTIQSFNRRAPESAGLKLLVNGVDTSWPADEEGYYVCLALIRKVQRQVQAANGRSPEKLEALCSNLERLIDSCREVGFAPATN